MSLPSHRPLLLLHASLLRQACLISTSCSRAANTKPWRVGDIKLWRQGIMDYRYRHGRGKKMAKIELPDFVKMREDTSTMSPDKMRSMMKEQGIVPPRLWDERPIVYTCSGAIIEPYLPDAPAKKITKRMKETAMRVYTRPVSKITKFLPDFDQKTFAENEAVTIYRRAHELLAQMGTQEDIRINEEDLLQYVTEKCYPEMLFRVDRKTIHWKWLALLEKPQFVQAKVIDGPDSSIVFGQVTVRLHSQQILAIYDRFGRLIHGSENVVKDVLEYVVYENFLSNSLGQWRIHGKVLPSDRQSLETPTTFRIKN